MTCTPACYQNNCDVEKEKTWRGEKEGGSEEEEERGSKRTD